MLQWLQSPLCLWIRNNHFRQITSIAVERVQRFSTAAQFAGVAVERLSRRSRQISRDGKFQTFSYCHGRGVFDVQNAPERLRLGL